MAAAVAPVETEAGPGKRSRNGGGKEGKDGKGGKAASGGAAASAMAAMFGGAAAKAAALKANPPELSKPKLVGGGGRGKGEREGKAVEGKTGSGGKGEGGGGSGKGEGEGCGVERSLVLFEEVEVVFEEDGTKHPNPMHRHRPLLPGWIRAAACSTAWIRSAF